MKLEVTITYRMELTVDDRVQKRDIEWAVYKAFDTCDGRQPFSCEMASNGVRDVGVIMARTAHDAMVQRIAQKYPATSVARLNSMHMGWSRFEQFFKIKPDVYFTPYQTNVAVREIPDGEPYARYLADKERLTIHFTDVG